MYIYIYFNICIHVENKRPRNFEEKGKADITECQ